MLRHTGMCHNIGSVFFPLFFFFQEIPKTWVPFFIQNPNLESNFQNFLGFGLCEPWKNLEILVNFCGKIARNVYLLQKTKKIWIPIFWKITPEHGYESWAAGSTSSSNPNLSTPTLGQTRTGWRRFEHLTRYQQLIFCGTIIPYFFNL